jgi:hypothetical protein
LNSMALSGGIPGKILKENIWELRNHLDIF